MQSITHDTQRISKQQAVNAERKKKDVTNKIVGIYAGCVDLQRYTEKSIFFFYYSGFYMFYSERE